MKRVNQYSFYQLGMILHPLSSITQESKLNQVWYMLHNAEAWLRFILDNNLFPLGVSRPACETLHFYVQQLKNVALAEKDESDKSVELSDSYNIRNSLQAFETVYAAELQSLDTYFVAQKLAYVTHDLIENAEKVLPEECVKIIAPDAVKDIREAGRCVAFELATAAGVHSMRATEKVLRQYYSHVTGKSAKRKPWSACTTALKKSSKANTRTVQILDQVRDRRNELMHPETFLSMNEALILFDIAKAAIAAMATDISSATMVATAPVP